MATPERAKPDTSPSHPNAELIAALADILRKLEIADEHENPMERFYKRDKLLEEQNWLQAEIEVAPPSEFP